MKEEHVEFDPDYWGVSTVSEDQPSLFPDEPPSGTEPLPTPIADAGRDALKSGWVPEGFTSALYVSAGTDTKAPVYLRNERFESEVAADITAPDFFVYVDQRHPLRLGRPELSHRDDRTQVETVDKIPFRSLDVRGHMVLLKITSDRHPDRQVVVLRLRMKNEDFALAALAEGWSPEWFIGVCDGCAGWGGNTRCENEVRDASSSIPIRLGVRYWVTDHLNCIDVPLPSEGETGEFITNLPNGSALRQVAFLSNDWSSSNFRYGSRIFEVMEDASGAPLT